MSVLRNEPPALAFKRSFALKNNLRASPRSDALGRMLGFCSPHPPSPDAAWDQVLKPGFLYVLFVYLKKTRSSENCHYHSAQPCSCTQVSIEMPNLPCSYLSAF